jgi:hypothetical protein
MPIAGKTIPKQTPFFLTGAATDVDGDSITYSWEEMDKGSSTTWDGGASTTTAPLFKSRPPTVSGTRYLPSLANINANFPANPNNTTGGLKGERLPTVNRTMNFKLTVRDNKNGGGGVATAGTNGCSISTPFSLNVSTLSGPFTVISPDGGEVWLGGTQQTVSWNVANTDAAPVSCAFVDILMSVDGGVTFDTVVATHVPNNGSATITVPNIQTNTTVRFLIRCSDNYFFDIGDADFQITQNSNPNPNGIFDVANSSTFSIHPNPANDFLLISGAAINETCTYQIFNILGEIIITNSIQVNSFAKAEPIDIAKLQAGVYFIQLKSDKISSAVKFIKN